MALDVFSRARVDSKRNDYGAPIGDGIEVGGEMGGTELEEQEKVTIPAPPPVPENLPDDEPVADEELALLHYVAMR